MQHFIVKDELFCGSRFVCVWSLLGKTLGFVFFFYSATSVNGGELFCSLQSQIVVNGNYNKSINFINIDARNYLNDVYNFIKDVSLNPSQFNLMFRDK